MLTKRRLILGVLAFFLLVFLYRVFTVYTGRSTQAFAPSGRAFLSSAGLSW
jgi:hypothetical protein